LTQKDGHIPARKSAQETAAGNSSAESLTFLSLLYVTFAIAGLFFLLAFAIY